MTDSLPKTHLPTRRQRARAEYAAKRPAVREYCYRRDGGRCRCPCRRSLYLYTDDPFQVAHEHEITPRSHGGSPLVSANVITLAPECHAAVTAGRLKIAPLADEGADGPVVFSGILADGHALTESYTSDPSHVPAEVVPDTLQTLEHFQFTSVGLKVIGDPTFEQWAHVIEILRMMHGAIQFWVADAIHYGESRWGELASQVIDAAQWAETTVNVYRWAASKVPPENRDPDLSLSHHIAVAALPPREQKRWLTQAKQEHWTVNKLTAEIRAAKGKSVWYGVLVTCEDEKQQLRLSEQLELQGYSVMRLVRPTKPEV
jgi:hypothetical protein